MSGQEVQRPPTSGPGSGVAAWREYAAAVTASPAESWASLSREDIIELLDAEGANPESATAAAAGPDQPVKPSRPRRPEWMVPTADGYVPEQTLRGR